MVADGPNKKSTVPQDALMPMRKTVELNVSSSHSSQAESVSDCSSVRLAHEQPLVQTYHAHRCHLCLEAASL
eukprot:2913942-Amphidinium_carterae.1